MNWVFISKSLSGVFSFLIIIFYNANFQTLS